MEPPAAAAAVRSARDLTHRMSRRSRPMTRRRSGIIARADDADHLDHDLLEGEIQMGSTVWLSPGDEHRADGLNRVFKGTGFTTGQCAANPPSWTSSS